MEGKPKQTSYSVPALCKRHNGRVSLPTLAAKVTQQVPALHPLASDLWESKYNCLGSLTFLTPLQEAAFRGPHFPDPGPGWRRGRLISQGTPSSLKALWAQKPMRNICGAFETPSLASMAPLSRGLGKGVRNPIHHSRRRLWGSFIIALSHDADTRPQELQSGQGPQSLHSMC